MVVVTVHTTQLHVLAVNFKDLADALHTLHTQMVVEVLVAQLYTVVIEVGLLCRPQQGLVDEIREFDVSGIF